MNMSERGKERVHLDIILKDRPIFIIRWGLLMFVVFIIALLILSYYAGYDITLYWQS
jgi:hypothetical protein